MNLIQKIEQYVAERFPGVETSMAPPLHSDGVWNLDIQDGENRYLMEWLPGRSRFGFGNIKDCESFTQLPESYDDADAMKRRLDEVLAW